MSFLFPLYLIGGLAVAGPIILHLIRRQTRNRVEFSSLMFLRASPPVIQKRSKLENLFLLLLRCLVLCLLALAFARPFLKGAMGEEGAGVGERVVVLIDTSASMRRDGVWDDAMGRVDEVIDEIQDGDGLAVVAFDASHRVLIGFEEWAGVAAPNRTALVESRLKSIEPTWGSTNLGGALVAGAELLEEAEAGDDGGSGEGEGIGVAFEKRMVLIGDVTEGSDLSALNTYAWPASNRLEVRRVGVEDVTNGSLQLVVGGSDGEETETLAGAGVDAVRVRVTNASDSQSESFELGWVGEGGVSRKVYVAAGQSRVVSAPKLAVGGGGGVLELRGDSHGFDNRVYVSEMEARRVRILYLGDDVKANPRQPLYYVNRAYGETLRRVPEVTAVSVGAELQRADVAAAHLVVVTGVLDESAIALLRDHLEAGRTVLVAMGSTDMGPTVAGLAGADSLGVSEASVRGYSMIETVDFNEPLMGAFRGGRFGDFTGIHFWKHRAVDFEGVPGARVLARFDNGDAAWVEIGVGKGALVVMTAGWHPVDSQMALSSKFVVWMYSVLERSGEVVAGATQYFVGDPATVRRARVGGADTVRIRKPGGEVVELEAGLEVFDQTDEPGEYVATLDNVEQRFAVNLGAGEGRTGPLDLGRLEQLGVTLSDDGAAAPEGAEDERAEAAERELARTEAEGRQKGWRWVVLGALCLLLGETWLAGWLVGPRDGGQETTGAEAGGGEQGDAS
ncbi:MAG: BatA domain-containing protein [Planctomycetota bacterium]|jgi:hypothetical protein